MTPTCYVLPDYLILLHYLTAYHWDCHHFHLISPFTPCAPCTVPDDLLIMLWLVNRSVRLGQLGGCSEVK
jgi:hypothetical protein